MHFIKKDLDQRLYFPSTSCDIFVGYKISDDWWYNPAYSYSDSSHPSYQHSGATATTTTTSADSSFSSTRSLIVS